MAKGTEYFSMAKGSKYGAYFEGGECTAEHCVLLAAPQAVEPERSVAAQGSTEDGEVGCH